MAEKQDWGVMLLKIPKQLSDEVDAYLKRRAIWGSRSAFIRQAIRAHLVSCQLEEQALARKD
jgi:metal-responsive CopG/Arc/MetJ family transcriptional regulator